MAKVTITIEDTAEGFAMHLDDLNPGVTLEQAMKTPTPAEALAFSLIAIAETLGKLEIGRIVDDAEYHAEAVQA